MSHMRSLMTRISGEWKNSFTSSRVTGLYFSHGNTLSGRGGEIDQSSDIFSSVLLVELFVGGFLGTRHICPVGDAEGGPGLLRRRVHPGARKGKHGCAQYRTF